MLKRFYMPLFIHPDTWQKLGFRKHFDDYVSKHHGLY
jgi:hypothetical protein